jgi:arylmalonate decarboxylase
MNRSRREFLLAVGAAAAAVGCSSGGDAGGEAKSGGVPVLGLIFPPAGRGIPEEGLAMYPSSVKFLATGLGLKTMTPDGYDAVIDLIPPVAKQLASEGAQAIALMGTSLSFYKGSVFNQRLAQAITEATGLPATTMSTGVIEGLKAVGARRVAAATAYNDEVNERLRAFLAESGFEPLVVKGLGLEAVESVDAITQDYLLNFAAGVRESAPEADSVLVSCGGFRTLEIIAPLEERTKLPVVSSTPHALRAGVRLLGLSGEAPGYGRLLAQG